MRTGVEIGLTEARVAVYVHSDRPGQQCSTARAFIEGHAPSRSSGSARYRSSKCDQISKD